MTKITRKLVVLRKRAKDECTSDTKRRSNIDQNLVAKNKPHLSVRSQLSIIISRGGIVFRRSQVWFPTWGPSVPVLLCMISSCGCDTIGVISSSHYLFLNSHAPLESTFAFFLITNFKKLRWEKKEQELYVDTVNGLRELTKWPRKLFAKIILAKLCLYRESILQSLTNRIFAIIVSVTTDW